MSGLSKTKIIECYQLIEEIGKGAYGKVYKGINLNNGIFVALKEIPISKEYIRSIKKQIHVLKGLNHKNIVKYEDAIVKDHKIYLILQYIEGGSLSNICKRSIFPESLIKLYVHQILEGLDYLHKQNIVHRDIKGLNLLLTKEGKLKIADFGVAVNINENQRTLSAGGSPYWMAPETIKGQQVINPKIDIWSLGCTVIELITGTPPYFELGPLPALFRIAEDVHPPLPKNTSSELIDFLLRCFEKDPQKRAKASELLQHKWIKSVNQTQLLLSRSPKNMRNSNMLAIDSTLKSGNLLQMLSLVKKTDNKKLIYYNRNILVLNQLQNNQLKLQLFECLISNDYNTYKYLQSLGMVKNLFTRECKELKISPARTISFIEDCYILGLQHDTFYMVQNNIVYYISMLCKHYLNKPEAMPLLDSIIKLLRNFTHDQLVLPTHILKIIQEEDTLTSISISFKAIVESKKQQTISNCLKIFNKYCQQNFDLQQSYQIFQYSLKELLNISLYQHDPKTSQQNLKLVLFLVRFLEYQQRMDYLAFYQYLSEYAKVLVLNKNVNEEYHEVVFLYIDIMVQYFQTGGEGGKNQRVRNFNKVGGIKRLKSLPKFLLQIENITKNINRIIKLSNQY